MLKSKSKFNGQILSKFDISLFNAYNPIYFDSYLPRATNGEFYLKKEILLSPTLITLHIFLGKFN